MFKYLKNSLSFFLIFLHLNINCSANLAKIFFHKGQDNKLVFYFDKMPKKTILDGSNTKSIVFKNIKIKSKETKSNFQKLKEFKNQFFTFKISKKNNDVELQIKFDPENIKINIFSAGVISGYESIIVEFLNLKKDTNFSDKEKLIILDPGHGGKDFGASGFGFCEKDITLEIAKKLKNKLEENGFKVIMTRSNDKYLPLDCRTSFSNSLDCDAILISLHCNYSLNNTSACGLETYFLNNNLLQSLNGSKVTNQNDCQKLAEHVHYTLINNLKANKIEFNDRKVKGTISQILLGTECPSILIELGFLSNKEDVEILTKKQELIVESLSKSIQEYLKK